MPIRRIIITLLIFLALGAMVNIAVAWVLAWTVFATTEIESPYDEMDSFHAAIVERGGDDVLIGYVASRSVGVESYDVFGIDLFTERGGNRYRADIDAGLYAPYPDWISLDFVREDELPAMKGFGGSVFVTRGFGVPCKSMAAGMIILNAHMMSQEQVSRVISGIRVRDRVMPQTTSSAAGLQYRVLPLRPIWPGFLINTLLYGTSLWMVCTGPFAVRRAIRRRRGRCAHCGYPVGTSPVCTECGRVTRAKSVVDAVK